MEIKNHYIKNSKLNKAFIDKIKDYEIVEDLLEAGTALADLEESFIKILNDLRFKIECTSKDDYENLLELFTDLWMELKHINYHINQAEPGFLKLTNFLSDMTEKE